MVLTGAGGCVWHWGGPWPLQHTAVKQNHAGWTRCPTLPARLWFLEAAAHSGGIDALPLAENAEHFAGFHREALQERGAKRQRSKQCKGTHSQPRDPPLQLQVPTTKACKEKSLPPKKSHLEIFFLDINKPVSSSSSLFWAAHQHENGKRSALLGSQLIQNA